MKTQSLTTALAFLVAAFMWGCQEQGSGPVGLDGPQFDKPFPELEGELCDEAVEGVFRDAKGHCHGDEEPPPPGDEATFTATFLDDCDPSGGFIACDVTGEVDLVGPHAAKKVLSKEPKVLGELFLPGLQTTITDGAACFGTDQRFSADLQIRQDKAGSAEANIWFGFTAKRKDGNDGDVNYLLELLEGVIAPSGNWPAVNGPSTITGGKFKIGHHFGPGREFACTGTGSLFFSALVVRTS